MADANQIKYLQNMANGKTSNGGAANAGQISWAKSQLAKIPDAAKVPQVKLTELSSNPSLPLKSNIPTPPQTQVSNPNTNTPSTPSIPQGSSVPTPPTQGYSNPQLQDWSQKQQELFKQWEQAINTPFNYDPEKDPAYQAQRQLAQQRAQQASINALEAANERGLLTSTIATNQLGQIQQAAEQEALSYIPQYREQAYNQYLNNLANIGQMLNQAYNLRNQQFNEGVTEAELTGSYLPAGARQLVDQIYALKAQAETKGITAEQRAQLSAQADQLRARLSAMGVDVSGLGADVSLANTRVGQRTLAGQQMDWQRQTDQRDFDESVRRYDQDFALQQERYKVADEQWQKEYGLSLAQITGYMPDGTPTSAQKQQELNNLWVVADQTGVIPNDLADMYGLPRGTQTRAAKEFAAQLAIQQQNANANMLSSQASMMNAQTNRMQENRLASSGRSSGGSNGSTSNNSNKIDAKDSYDIYAEIVNELGSRSTGFSKNEALKYAQTQKPYLTDTHYKYLVDYITKNGK